MSPKQSTKEFGLVVEDQDPTESAMRVMEFAKALLDAAQQVCVCCTQWMACEYSRWVCCTQGKMCEFQFPSVPEFVSSRSTSDFIGWQQLSNASGTAV
eukprot:scaffold181405_cov14-Tisochrysis_lutea.AAC.1